VNYSQKGIYSFFSGTMKTVCLYST